MKRVIINFPNRDYVHNTTTCEALKAFAEPGRGAGNQPAYLSDPTDRRAIIGELRFIRRLFAATA